MLQAETELQSGTFESSVLRKNQTKSADRQVRSYELELFQVDTGVCYVDGHGNVARRGMLLCARPGQIRHSEFPIRCSFVRIAPKAAEREGLVGLLESLPTVSCLPEEEIEGVMGLFARLGHRLIVSDGGELRQLRVNAALLELLYRLCRICGQESRSSSKRELHPMVRGAYEYINEHYAENCSLSRLSEAVNASPNYLRDLFTEQVGMTPYDYVTERRVNAARERIMAGESSMYEIALAVGFCSQSHFCKVFRQKTGMTPASYRQELLRQY